MTLTLEKLTVEELVGKLNAAKPETPVYERPTREAPSAEEVADAFDALNGIFTFSRSSNGLMVNDSARLNEAALRFANSSIASFNERLQSSSLVVDKAANGSVIPNTIERLSENAGIRIETAETLERNVAQSASGGCGWQWWFNTYWWGFKLSFNSCALNWLSAGGKAIDDALKAFKLPAIATPIVKLLAAILKPFDKGNGSTLYFTWIGAIWITAK